MKGLTHSCKRFSPHLLMKAQGITSVSFFYNLAEIMVFQKTRALQVVFVSPSAGEAVRFTTQYLLNPTAGRRPRVPGAVVIIADGKSADNLSLAASSLKATGESTSKCNADIQPCWICLHSPASVVHQV